MITDPGSDRQCIHSDIPFHNDPQIYSAFVALQDITVDMGPTEFLPATVSKTAHHIWYENHSF